MRCCTKRFIKKDYCIGDPQEKLDYQSRLYDILIRENVMKLFKLEEDFGRFIKKTKVNINFLFKLRFHLDKVEKKQEKVKLKKLRSLSSDSVYKKLLIERFFEHLPHCRFKLEFVKFCNSNI